MAYFGSVPWHGDGTPASEDQLRSVEEFGKAADILWGVHKEPLMTVASAQTSIDAADDWDDVIFEPNVNSHAVVRNSDQSVLGVVGPRYQPLQNRDALKWFEPWLESKELAFHTAGSLCGGQKVWVLAQVTNNDSVAEVSPGDDVGQFVMLSNSHDGTTSVRVGFSRIRIVCANTLAQAHRDRASQLIRIRHSQQLQVNLENIREIMNVAKADFEADVEKYQFLASRHINTADLRKYVKTCLGIDTSKTEDDLSTRSKNTLERVIGLIDAPAQVVSTQSKHTYWTAYNAVNEFFGYHQGRNESNRLNSLWFGVNKANDQEAFKLALEMAV